MALVIAGERSGCGKTTITLMLLAALSQVRISDRSLCRSSTHPRSEHGTVQSFKVGPDYIDPMFHRYITGRPCYNLDPILTSANAVRRCFAEHPADYCLIEGVMGLFDGAVWPQEEAFPDLPAGQIASTAHIAALLQIPIALVIDCSRLSGSVAAIAQGYKSLNPKIKLVGVILNRVGSDRHLAALKTALTQISIPILGTLRRHTEITLPDRHLGLVPTDELPELEAIAQRLGEIGASSFDWQRVLPLLRSGAIVEEEAKNQAIAPLSSPQPWRKPTAGPMVPPPEGRGRIAVARDRAFNFQYAENLEQLEAYGAELIFWSPITQTLPERITGLYLSGGFPEMFAQQLFENKSARVAVKEAIAAGLPTYAECGGLMYLCEALQDFEGRRWPMVGVLPTVAHMAGLTLGYRRAIVQRDTPLLRAGEIICGHEFHHSNLQPEPTEALYCLWGNDLPERETRGEGWGGNTLHASYVHLHWGARPEIAARFMRQGLDWRRHANRKLPHFG
ncbi:MAG: cobyrinate a,c-diamide synthase [Synechococcales cyanobacterium CRU_2_2]|nr:cobyrinate a,c-diamide synthase [Synechococcales cyanobacterium CRU_2_2]